MKNVRLYKILFLFNLCFIFNHYAIAEQLRVSIPHMPVHAESDGTGILIDFAKVLAKKLQRDIDIQIVPFPRSMYYVSNNKVDFHLPFIKANIKPQANQKQPNNNFIQMKLLTMSTLFCTRIKM